MLFLATLINDTKTIKLATGTTNLVADASGADRGERRDVRPSLAGPLHFRHQPRRADVRRRGARHSRRRPQQDVRRRDRRHPGDLGARSALRHRFARQPLQGRDSTRTAALDFGVGIMAKPFQKPRPEIVGTVVAPFSPGVVLMGKRDFHPLSANFLLPKHLQVALAELRQGQGRSGPEGRHRRLARRAHDLRRRRRQDGAALRARRRQQPVPFLFRADAAAR